MQNAIESLPPHLKKYVVEQDYSRYTPVDHAVWRFILRQLSGFLAIHAHESYLEGLEKTGIEIERIPKISDISAKLANFGWRAIPVSGFIPPAAFMEMQSLSLLPIASDMRSLDHLLYTPAPDIVHEAAGHAPILVHPEFASYLKDYAQVARRAIISKEDLDLYEAIRELSDLKENPGSTASEIQKAEAQLELVAKSATHVSEATQLGRMNWWTAEYGLIGDLKNPRIFGAGLLSSLGESRECLGPQVRKIPLSVECVEMSYDITEPQPQLFVASHFSDLKAVLEKMAQTMAFRTGGISGLKKALLAKTVNTVGLNSGLQISGELVDFEEEIFVKFSGHCQLSVGEKELPGHGRSYHAHGYSSPLGFLAGNPKQCPSTFTLQDWKSCGVEQGARCHLTFVSGFEVQGSVTKILIQNQRTLLITFNDCTVKKGSKVYFEPAWGSFDLALGSKVVSVFGGAADREAFGETQDFVSKRVPVKKHSSQDLKLFSAYQRIRDLRGSGGDAEKVCAEVLQVLDDEFPQEWLLRLEIHEVLSLQGAGVGLRQRVQKSLQQIIEKFPAKKAIIEDGMKISGFH